MFSKLVCIILIVTCFIVSWSFHDISGSRTNPPKDKFGVIIDCSSFTTSVTIFVWKSSFAYPEILNNINFLSHKNGVVAKLQIPQNLNNLFINSYLGKGYIKSIVDYIDSNIPEESKKFMKIYIMGTSNLDQHTQQVKLEQISQKIKERLNIPEIEVSEETELNIGVYNWIAINSLSRRFIESVQKRTVKKQTIAVVEMNHNNVQVTFHYKIGMDALIAGYLQKKPNAYKTLQHLTLEPGISKRGRGGYPYTIISVLFKDLGIEKARSAYIDFLIKNQFKTIVKHIKNSKEYKEKDPLIVQDPCLPNEIVEVLHKPIRMLFTNEKTIGFKATKDEDLFTLSIKGSGDYWKCKSYLKNLLHLARAERLSCHSTDLYCSTSLIGSLFIPFEFYEVVGIIEFHDIANKLNLGGNYDRNKISQKTKEYCTSPYKKLLEKYAKPYRDEDYVVIQNCFKALWIDTFLTYALKMPDDFKNFSTIEMVGGNAFEWTLGAMVNKSLATI